jgi:hypothetical protein
VATTQQATFKELPGTAPDIMRDHDLAALGYEETEFSIEGTAASLRRSAQFVPQRFTEATDRHLVKKVTRTTEVISRHLGDPLSVIDGAE